MGYAIVITILLALVGLVGGWIKGPSWSQIRVIGLFSALLVAVVVLTYVQSSHPDSTPSTTPTQITSSDEETTTGRPQPTATPYITDEETATEIPTVEGRTVQATDLQVGDCYNKPDATSATTDNDGKRQVGSVEVVDCEVPHQHEVYNNYKITLPTLPDSDTMQSEIQTACYSSFEDYVGKSYEKSRYEATALIPNSDSWAQGNRTITCTLVTKDGSLITGSLKGAAK